jgi:hypothetical protein
MGTKAMEHGWRASRLRALKQLLEYALAESKDLGLAHLDQLLGAAALAVSDELDKQEDPAADHGCAHPRPRG